MNKYKIVQRNYPNNEWTELSLNVSDTDYRPYLRGPSNRIRISLNEHE